MSRHLITFMLILNLAVACSVHRGEVEQSPIIEKEAYEKEWTT